MKLISLKLLNYRKFRKEEIIFYDDFSLIFWKNGSWKSSIFDAVWYRLFWSNSKDFIRVKNKTSLKSHFATDKDPSKVELVFQVWSQTYRIVRVIDNWSKKFSDDFIKETKDVIFCWEKELAFWWWEINDAVINIIWFSRDTFLKSVFSKQKDIEVLSWPSSERKNLINSILGLDKLDILIKDLKIQLKEKEYDFKSKNSYLDKIDIQSLEENLNLLRKKLNEYNNLLDIQNKEKEQKFKVFELLKKDFNFIDKKRSDYLDLLNKKKLEEELILDLENTIKNIDLKLKDIEKKEIFFNENKVKYEKEEELKKELLELEKQKQLFEQRKKLEKDLDILNENKNMLEVKINTNFKDYFDFENSQNILQEKIDKLEKEILQKSNYLSKLNQDLENIKEAWEKIKNELEIIKNLWEESSCPTCKRKLWDYFPHLVSLLEDELLKKRQEYKEKSILFKKIEQDLKKMQQEKIDFKSELQNLVSMSKEYLVLDEKLKNLVYQIDEKTKELSSFKEVIFDEKIFWELQKEFSSLQKEIYTLNEIKAFINQKDDFLNEKKQKELLINIKKDNLAKISFNLSKIDFSQEKYDEIKKNYEYMNNDIIDINKKISEISENCMKIDFEIQKIQSQINDFKNIEASIKNIKNDIYKMNLKIDILSSYTIYLQDILKPKIESISSIYFQLITDYKYSQITLDNDYNIFIDWKIIDFYSWWEKDLANLCLRLSLWQILNESTSKWTNFLVLDEILASQDKRRQENIVLNLKKLENKFSQIFLISHIEELKDLATNLIEIFEKNEFESWVRYY